MPKLTQKQVSTVWRDKWILLVLAGLLGLLQYRLWFGKNSVPDYLSKEQEVEKQSQQNANLVQRNALLKADISDLTIGMEAIEERARNELGLIKRGETFYRILPSEEE
ncbi:hypothetical protein AltI4_06550 [Alteromonas sp. I4]|nr:hypothetical protein AltI4_06550 [Alteromonas sp. I4]